jgi:hypothetical protein
MRWKRTLNFATFWLQNFSFCDKELFEKADSGFFGEFVRISYIVLRISFISHRGHREHRENGREFMNDY